MIDLQKAIDVIQSLKMSFGEAFFTSITSQLHSIIEADYTFIAVIDKHRRVSQTIAFVSNNGIEDNFEYALEHTPCSDVSDDSVCLFANNVVESYPLDQLLIDMNINGYVGTPLHDSNGGVTGLIVGLFNHPIKNVDAVAGFFQLFAGRISAELERGNMVKALENLNASLELIVDERTRELTIALETIEATQKQIIEQEKQASLGRLVSGVAHEINTPLGVAILAETTLANSVDSLNVLVKTQQLTKGKLTSICEEVSEASSIINFNLARAAELVVNFKQISSDQINDDLSTIALGDWLASVAKSMTPMAKKYRFTLEVDSVDSDVNITTYSAKLYQVVNNIVTNTFRHGFDEDDMHDLRKCRIQVQCLDNETIQLTITDNGKGIEASTLNRIYEPFFTTKRGNGGTGLGMSIVYSLVTGPLKGDIAVTSQLGMGTKSVITLPIKLSVK